MRNKVSLIVIGNGMVGYKFCKKMVDMNYSDRYNMVVFGEEPRPAYDRLHITDYFSGKTESDLLLAPREWYEDHGIQLFTGEKVVRINRQEKYIVTTKNKEVSFDKLILCTGSVPFVPRVPGIEKKGVFAYRTIEDLDKIRAYAKRARTAAVVGGGLLGLEAVKALSDLGLAAHVLEFSPRLMLRQLDDAGAAVLKEKIEALGVTVHVNKATTLISGSESVERIHFKDDSALDVDMVVFSAGITPRDELARQCGLEVGERGGVVVNDVMQTSDPSIYAMGEVALHKGVMYGLVAPCYEMADVLATNLMGGEKGFRGHDLSVKLKLKGIDVASFGNVSPNSIEAVPLVYENKAKGVYKKLFITKEGTRLLGGILVGDATDYQALLQLYKNAMALPDQLDELMFMPRRSSRKLKGIEDLPETAQICSCENVSKGMICTAIREKGITEFRDLQKATKAGTGCGGCVPLLKDILKHELKVLGKEIKNVICEHFAYSRGELFQIIKINKMKSYDAILRDYGTGNGCEVCKPVVASILASQQNDWVINHQMIQDTNDRYLGNIQRNGTYSIVPRIPGGEITPEKLIILGTLAKKYDLFCKITGGQRIDLLGARIDQLPEIWEALINAGFESGHAYGKAVRTVKSCVGSAWCRFGVQDSLVFAIRVEERYKGIRAPHKLKSAVSGCARECAEAQSKDFGIIATEKGWNLYVCGNGGMKPQHAQLLASDLDDETCLTYIDRFLMYYIYSADLLTRTATWLNKLDGGIEYLKDVIINDKLGICEQLEVDMQFLVDTYECEWNQVVKTPEKRKQFSHFANTMETDNNVDLIEERGQRRPVDWKKEKGVLPLPDNILPESEKKTAWVRVAKASDVPADGGVTIKYGNTQIALFNFATRGEWYACQNLCPHKFEMVLSRGLIGETNGQPKVACPMHKKTFNLKSGACLSGDPFQLLTFTVKVKENHVYLKLPDTEALEEALKHPALAGCH